MSEYNVRQVEVDMISRRGEPYLPYEMKTLSEYLNEIEGEVIAIIPNVDSTFFGMANGVNYLIIVERIVPAKDRRKQK